MVFNEVLFQQYCAKGYETMECSNVSELELQAGHISLTNIDLLRYLSLVGRQLFDARHRKFLTFGGTFKFHNYFQNFVLASTQAPCFRFCNRR